MLTTPPLHTKQQIHVFNTIQIYHFLASKRKSFIPITTWLYFCRKWLDSQWVQIEDKIQVHIIENPKEKWVLSLFHTHTEKQKSTISNESVGSALARNLVPVHPPLPACMEHTFHLQAAWSSRKKNEYQSSRGGWGRGWSGRGKEHLPPVSPLSSLSSMSHKMMSRLRQWLHTSLKELLGLQSFIWIHYCYE